MPALATYEQSVSPESVTKVPLADLSFFEAIEPFAHPGRGRVDLKVTGKELHCFGERRHRDHLDVFPRPPPRWHSLLARPLL
jgi:hypothetical protein